MKYLKFLLIITSAFIMTVCAGSTNINNKVKNKDNDPQYQYEKAVVAMNYNLEDLAIEYLNKAILLNPNHYESYYLLGLAYERKQKNQDAEQALQKCLKIHPEHSKAYFNLGLIYEKLNKKKEAEEAFKKAYSLNNNVDAAFKLAALYYEQEKFDSALNLIQYVLKTKPKFAQAFNLQGVVLNKMKQMPGAIASFINALKIKPDDIIFKINLATAYINNKEYEIALQLLEKILPKIKDQSLITTVNKYIDLIKSKKN